MKFSLFVTVYASHFALAAILFLSACGSNSNDASDLGDAPPSTGKDTRGAARCNLASPAEVDAALGMSGLAGPTSRVNSIVTECDYALGNDSSAVTLRYEGPETAADFVTVRKNFVENGGPIKDVAGLGESAFSSSIGLASRPVNSVVVYSKSQNVMVVSHATIDQEIALLRQIIAKL